MNAKAEFITHAAGSGSPTHYRMGPLPLELGFTGVLIGAFILGAVYLTWATSGPTRPSVGIILEDYFIPPSVTVLLSLIERFLPPAGPRKSFRSWLLHTQIGFFATFMLIPTGILGAYIATALSRHLGFSLGLIDLRMAAGGRGLLALFGAVWVSSIANDFFFYWCHRALHKSTFLWQHHKMHHMDPELEAMSVSRQNWIEAFLQMLFIAIPLSILFKVDTLDSQGVGVLGAVIAMVFGNFLVLGHMNVRFQVGWASMFFCSPQVHRIHHSRLPQHRDRNFAFVLPLWDVLFGTYYAPQRDEFPPSGVDGETEIRSFWEAQIFTQREWWKMFQAWRRQRRDLRSGSTS